MGKAVAYAHSPELTGGPFEVIRRPTLGVETELALKVQQLDAPGGLSICLI